MLSAVVWAGLLCFTAFAEEVNVLALTGGDVKVIKRGNNVGALCEKGMALVPGDWVRTGPGSTCTLGFGPGGKNRVTVEENSLTIVKPDGYCKMQLLNGGLYTVLENVAGGEVFRVTTPSVITEAMSSGWAVRDNGSYTNVVCFDNEVFVCGLNQDGTAKEKQFWVKEGFQRKTVQFEDPGEEEKVPEEIMAWFRTQVLSHYLDKSLTEENVPVPAVQDTANAPAEEKAEEKKDKPRNYSAGGNTIMVDGEEVDLIEYIYRKRLQKGFE
ncbi:MAG: FecR domain-containing protein [Candidatus Omnitrophica bacterium]|nr:FecR domain-containing protein [Candidatus Omnitrophota bacterium]